ncbi:MAG: metal-dependent hydrolase [Gammaproteobacteria bacterium]|nr:metal-dependent hydrolase [Gammaproteobacteria bacterium]
MYIAHIPAGFLLTHVLVRQRLAPATREYNQLLLLGIIASILPDSDYIYYHLVDQQQHFHHSYWTHIPLFWVAYYVLTLGLIASVGQRHWITIAHVFFLNVLLHCVLDSSSGGILWLYPWDQHYYRLARVPLHHPPRFGDFFWHWTFLLEVAIIMFAALVALKIFRPFTWYTSRSRLDNR